MCIRDRFRLTQPPQVDLSHATSPTVSNVPHTCLPCPPVHWSPNEQAGSYHRPFFHLDHYNIISIGVELCVNLTFLCYLLYGNSDKNTKILEYKKLNTKMNLLNGKNTQIDLLAIVPYYLHLFLITPTGGEAIQLGSLRKIMQVR